jgi:hypothetical protein
LIRDTKQGIALFSGTMDFDFQGRTGVLNCQNKYADIAPISSVAAREIVNGKLGRAIDDVAVLLNSTQFWKGLLHVGGAKGRTSVALESTKGQPEQSVAYSASAVPVKLKEVTVVDARRQF